MIPLVTLEQAKEHLHVTVSDQDSDIEGKVLQASAIVLRHAKKDVIPDEWMINTSPPSYDIPYNIQAATLLQVGELYYKREAGIANVLSDAVKALIDRDPTLA